MAWVKTSIAKHTMPLAVAATKKHNDAGLLQQLDDQKQYQAVL
jgi:hypothetical protein